MAIGRRKSEDRIGWDGMEWNGMEWGSGTCRIESKLDSNRIESRLKSSRVDSLSREREREKVELFSVCRLRMTSTK